MRRAGSTGQARPRSAAEILGIFWQDLGGFTQQRRESIAVTLVIDPENEASLAVAGRCGFERQDDLRGQRFFARSIT